MRKSIYEFSPDDARRFAQEQGIRTFQRGDELHFQTCPYCHGNAGKDKKTFAIHLTDGQFCCMRASCGARGNMLTLARDFGFSLGRDVDEYYSRKDRYKNMRKYPRPTTKAPAVEYMETRGISKDTTEKYAITVQRDHDNILVFPFFDERGDMQFIKYRKTDYDSSKDKSKEWCEADCKPILFGMDHCDAEKSDTLVMTEGQIDSLSCSEAGIPNAVSVPTGKNGFTWIPHCWDFLCQYKTLIVFGDHERDEITLLDDMKIRFKGTVKHVQEEDYKDCKDANEILRKYGKQAILDAVAHAVPVENKHVKRMSEVRRLSLADLPRVRSGIKALDEKTGGFYYGQLIILTGERGKGKSTMGSQFIASAIEQEVPTFIYSGEMPNWCVREWLDRQLAGKANIRQRRQADGFVVDEVRPETACLIGQWYYDLSYIYDEDDLDDSSDETLLETVRKVILQYGCKVLLLDNLMTAMPDDMSYDQYRQQTSFVRELAKMARQLEVVIFLVAHPRKAGLQEFKNDDISGSGNIANLASMILRYDEPRKAKEPEDKDKDPGDRILQITKNRLTGRVDFAGIPLWYEESSKRISDTQGSFDWHYAWEGLDAFVEVPDDGDKPFEGDGDGMDLPF